MDDAAAANHDDVTATKNRKGITLLVLGDGDFSFSLDWARYLAHNSSIYPSSSIHLKATGLDTQEALLAKYTDSTFLLSKLKGLDETLRQKIDAKFLNTSESHINKDKRPIFRVSVHHGVNAICQPDESAPSSSLGRSRAQHVVFHHPHLGTEDAALHSQFLCHLFFSVATVWLAEDEPQHDTTNNDSADVNDNTPRQNYFHLTLVKGQFTRWKCTEAMERHGMILIDRRPFCPPKVEHPYYQHRRHQTGRSFHARAPEGSETFTFVRRTTESLPATNRSLKEEGDDGTSSNNNNDRVVKLVGMLLETTSPRVETVKVNKTSNNNNCGAFPCPDCDKVFQEERSRNCHIKAVHGSAADKKRKRQDDATYSCSLCRSKDGGPRLFQSSQALEAHQQAKHFAEHTEIKPDWLKIMPVTLTISKKGESDLGCCDICGVNFTSSMSREDHRNMFVPSDVANGTHKADPLLFECTYCKRAFRENRAQRQHENFCKAKPVM